MPGLSHFGFADDLAGEPVVWHDPGVQALLGCGHQALRGERQGLQEVLRRARDENVRFALILRQGPDGSSTCSQEFSAPGRARSSDLRSASGNCS
ncbi:MAG: hypothetical protein AB1758_27180, partial [Candidatus Eremiobacterota bacterium]